MAIFIIKGKRADDPGSNPGGRINCYSEPMKESGHEFMGSHIHDQAKLDLYRRSVDCRQRAAFQLLRHVY